MALYHPPKPITNNAAPSITADLTYEAHGKCGQTRIIRSDTEEEEGNIFDAATEGFGNACKMVIVNVGQTGQLMRCDCNLMGMIATFRANNMIVDDWVKLEGFPIYGESIPFEIMADITYVALDTHYANTIAILYMDCEQS